MNNKLFLVCPFSCMENFIRQKFGDNVFFITAMAAVFQFNETEYLKSIKDLIEREEIQEIIIASDTSCRFINGVLNDEKEFGSYAETQIKNILLENVDGLTNSNRIADKQKIIAQFIIKNQAQELSKHYLFRSEILKNKIVVKGIVTTKSNNEIVEINFNNN